MWASRISQALSDLAATDWVVSWGMVDLAPALSRQRYRFAGHDAVTNGLREAIGQSGE
jgi:hypothetical protein